MKSHIQTIKSITLLVLLFAMTQMVQAQLVDNSGAIVKGVATKTKSYSTIKIGFTFKMVNKGKTILKNGYVWVKGDKFLFDFNKQVVMCNGTTQWTYLEEANEVSISHANADEESINPAFILNDYDKKYKTKLIKEFSDRGKYLQVVDLYPLKASSLANIRITIQKNTQQITKMMVVEKGGDTYEYLVNSFVVNQPISNAVFEFNAQKYPKVDINDMR